MPTPVVASFVELASDTSSSHALPEGQRRYLRLVDARSWHYSIVCILVLDFVANCLGVAATSTETYADGSVYLRCASSACLLVQAVDLGVRTLGLRSKLVASRANLVDAIAFLLLCACLACRFRFADNIEGATITTDGYVDKWHIFTKYKLLLYEADIALAYCFLTVLRILVKPPARTYSKSLHRSAKPDRVSIASLRASIRQLPSISAASVEKMETELRILSGADDGYMLPEAFMTFVERAYAFRPNTMTASAFLSHFQQVQLVDHAAYGIREVMASTFKHWSNQRWFLLATMLVVCVSASIVPLLSFYLKLLTDEGFPSYVKKTIVPDWDYTTMLLTGTQTLGVSRKFKNLTRGANNEEVDLKFVAYESFLTGIIGILAICVPFIAADYAMGFFQSKLISRATKHLQTSLLRVILQQPSSFFHDRSEGDLNNLFQADIARVNAMWQAVFWNFLNPVVSISVGFVYLMTLEPIIGSLAFAFAIIIVTSGPQGRAGKRSQYFGSQNAHVAADVQNAIACNKVVHAYEIQAPILAKFGASFGTLRSAQFAKDFWSGIVQIYIESAMFVFVMVMTICLGIKTYRGDITSGEFFACLTLLNRISTPVTVLGGFMRVAIGNASSLQRLDEILVQADKTAKQLQQSDMTLPELPKMQHALTLDHVSFKYDAESPHWILKDVSALFKKGEYACIVGPSGCGKSTLLGCLMQFYPISAGALRLDAYDTQHYSKASLSDQTAVVFQDGGVLNGSILDNIAYGRDGATREACLEAAKLAECHVFVDGLKDGYDTIIGQHAVVNLSGGQIQRICLARALVRQPSLLLLDEATSALDPETEASIVQTLEKLVRSLDMTIISVTHRIATTQNADVIFVMQAGAIVERGTYNELLFKPKSVFAELAKTKASQKTDRFIRFGSRASMGGDPSTTFAAVERLARGLENRSMMEQARSRTGSHTPGRIRSQNGSQLRGTHLDVSTPMLEPVSGNVRLHADRVAPESALAT
ncbi:hypothetical protein SPRG_14614 [Saprolegnia parasitica CBS 223.65]|uniref:Uncharacterized protein n=1 Tax=Saprolegnia parasitica (strain CBS 223.65) TaxID=695850 RepID=A0A067BNS8_SAPPC|nr:hypothetical protein SPRG_14614 [Saprolegnia parasitica CBS 223.65]KDO20134.1 hypothetical protein SPRG_14614 [Saprolegnia parasitica CBS 223.65]|eukprot:XP_012209176.1 hypothetical protein SPRG_14614 [Saprolegnia parasitica CBS 223.65]